MLTVKEVAERLSVSPSTIRYYDDEGLLPVVERDQNGYRLFKEDDLFWLRFIQGMRSTGMSIETLRQVVHLRMKGKDTLNEQIKILKEHYEKLQDQKKDIDVALGKLKIKMKILKAL
jgi:DNA-binding transcriptional MerR regulator